MSLSKLKILLLSICFLNTYLIFSGDNKTNELSDKISINISYLGELGVHPGITLGIGYTAYSNSWYELTPQFNVSWYIHRRNHQSFIMELDFLQKAKLPSGAFLEMASGFGFILTRPDAPVYIYDDEIFIEDGFPWSPKFQVSIFGGGGWTFEGEHPIDLYLNLGSFLEYPFNSYWLPHGAIHTGIRYSF